MVGAERERIHRRIAVVGCGGAGQLHADALARAGMAPAALVDPDPRRRAAVAEPWPGAAQAGSADEVLDAFDVAIVAAPDVHHAAAAVALAEAGKHVLVEKPMAATRAEGDAIRAVAARTDAVVAVAQVRRHLAVLTWAGALVRAGALGAVSRVDLAQGGRDDWVASSAGYVDQSFGGVIADQGAHAIDLLSWWFGPLTVVACRDDAHGGHEADATVELRAGPIPVRLELSRVRSKRNTLRVEAERGVLEVAVDHFQPRQLVAVPDGLDVDPFVEQPDDLARQFDRQLVAFTAALDGRWPAELATVADGAAVAGVIEDCYRCRTGEEPWWMTSAAATAGGAP